MTNNEKITKKHYEDFEDKFLFALSDVVKNNGLKVSFAAEIASNLLSNRTAKGIEQRLGKIIRNELDPNKVAVVLNIEKRPDNDSSTLPVAALAAPALEEAKEKEVDPMDVFAAIMNGEFSSVTNEVEEITVSNAEFNKITNTKNNNVIEGNFTPRRLPFFDESDIGKTVVVVVNNVVDYGFFADNNEKTGLVRGKSISQSYTPYHMIPSLVKRGDVITVEIVRDDFNKDRVVLQPFYDVNGEMIKGDILDSLKSVTPITSVSSNDIVEEPEIVYSSEEGFKNTIKFPIPILEEPKEEVLKEETFQFLSYDVSSVPNSNIDMLVHLVKTEAIIQLFEDFSSNFNTKGKKLFLDFSFDNELSLSEKEKFDEIIKDSINFCK